MKFREIYNPKQVYEGYFETYFIRPFIHHYADFKGRESGTSCLRSLLAWLVVSMGVAGIMMGQVGLIGPEAGTVAAVTVCSVWVAASLIPLAALLARASHGAPERAYRPRLLGVDTLLGVSCLLFFVLGLMMMITTLNSGSLNPNATATDEEDTTAIEEEYVVEEPIFTYQDAAPDTASARQDTLDLGTDGDGDVVTPEESFDPTIETPAEEIIEQPVNDTM